MAVLEDHGFTGGTSALHGPDFQRTVLPCNVYYHMAYGDLAVDAEHMDDAYCCYMEAL